MGGIDPMYNLVNTILDDKEVVIFLGAGASMEGTQDGKRFSGFGELIDKILKDWGFDPSDKEKRLGNFLEVIKKWEKEKILSARLSKYLDGEPGRAHYSLAALSIALLGEGNAVVYLTTNYDSLMNRAFSDLERNPVRKFNTVVMPLRPTLTNSEFQEIVRNIEARLKGGWPVIIKLFGDLNSQNPIFKQEDMKFEPGVEEKLLEWMRKPMISIGYSFSDKIIQQLLIASRGNSPVFLVTPSGKELPASIKDLDRVYHIKKSFSEFIIDLFKIFKQRNPSIIEKADKIIDSIGLMRIKPSDVTADSLKAIPKEAEVSKEPLYDMKQVKRILILSANPKTTPRLRLDEESREIEEGLLRAKHRGQFMIQSNIAVRLRDIRRALLDYEPQIVHFTGHGRGKGLFVENELGMGVAISLKALSGLFELFSDKIECVILSACYSASQANAISKHINYVIGMRTEIEDKAAIEFAVGFYDALGAGRSVEDAFKFGCNAILQVFPDLPEHLIPILKKKRHVSLKAKMIEPLPTAAERFFKNLNAKVIREANSILRIESINGHLQPYVPIIVLLVNSEPTEKDVMELVRQAKKIGKHRKKHAGILIYREPPNAMCRMKIVEVRLREDFILIPIPLISMEKALLDRDTCFGLLTQYAERYLPGADFFDARNAIGDTFSFFGRLELLDRLGEELEKLQSIGLFGLRKSGKTSILLQLNFTLRRHPVVYVDLQLYQSKSIYGVEVFNNVIQQLLNLIQIAEIVEDRFTLTTTNVKLFSIIRPAKELTTEFSTQIIELAQKLQEVGYKLPIICLLDEVERIIPFPDESKEKVEEFNAFFGVLRVLSQQYRKLSLLVTDLHPDCNRINQWPQPGVPTNPVFNFFKEEFVAPFSEEDTKTMLTDIGYLMTRTFDNKTLSAIHTKSGGQPYIARQIASLLCKKIPIKTAQRITWENCQEYLENTLLYSDSLIDYIEQNIWADFSKRHFEPAMLVLRILASNYNGMTRLDLLSYLKKQCSQNKIVKALLWLESIGLVEKNFLEKKEMYTIRIPLLTQWLEMEYGKK